VEVFLGSIATWSFNSRVLFWPVGSGIVYYTFPAALGKIGLSLLSLCVPLLLVMQVVWVLALATSITRTALTKVDENKQQVYVSCAFCRWEGEGPN
jgi:hypothetical protein